MNNTEALVFLKNVIHSRIEAEINGNRFAFPVFKTADSPSKMNEFIQDNQLSTEEIVILLLALVPHLDPGFFQRIIAESLPQGGDLPEFGGVKGKNHRGILPTGETVLFVLAGQDIEKRIEVLRYFSEDHFFSKKGMLYVEAAEQGEPKMSGRLTIDEEYVDLFTIGKVSNPQLGRDFPAEKITTTLEWEDLVLREDTMFDIGEIKTWLNFNEKFFDDWNMRGKIKPGYRIIFHGPSGTGKTLTACLLGKHTDRDVFRIDLSLVVSKYIGETEKNLSKLFDKAANKDWVLFFDEADSIFGKRTNVRDAHDKYANQEVSYLLQRIESHPGLVVLASNMKSNIDTSFTRRFNSIIKFENPNTAERVQLWKNYLPAGIPLEKKLNMEVIARKYHLTGANIVNVVQYAGLQTLQKKNECIAANDILKGIQKEYDKEGKMM